MWPLRSSTAELRLLSPTTDTAPIRVLKRLVLIEGVLDKGVSEQPDYIHRPDYRSVKIQDSRLWLVSGWDSPLRGRQAWRSGYYVSFLVTDSM